MWAPRLAGVALMGLALAECGTVNDQTAASQTTTEVMTGRWILAAPDAPSCGMNFAGSPSVQEGKLSPEGGCPEKFYLSRNWSLDQKILLIKDENGETLAQLTFGAGRFEGKSAAGTPVTLTR